MYYYNYPDDAIYALIDNSKMEVFVFSTKSLFRRLVQLVYRNRDYPFIDMNSASLVYLQLCEDDASRKVLVNVYRDYYSEMGYKLVGDIRNELSLTVDYIKYRGGRKGPKIVDVILRNRAKHAYWYVGRFSTEKEAQEFISLYYNKEVNPYCLPVYATNDRTVEYMKSIKESMKVCRRKYYTPNKEQEEDETSVIEENTSQSSKGPIDGWVVSKEIIEHPVL